MSSRPFFRQTSARAAVCLGLFALSAAAQTAAPAPATTSAPTAISGPVVLDRVVAVVNRQAILESDVEADIELSVLDPAVAGQGALTPDQALQGLIGRALTQQQIRQEDLPSVSPTAAEVSARIEEIRKELPACVHAHCSAEAGWKTFLAAHDLTPQRVQTYVRNRMEILRFIEERFRQGILITRQQIETYYRDTLLPQYAPGEPVPPLDRVASRIQKILLQQQVNVLFDNWLDNLRSQGDVEILDPALETAQTSSGGGGGDQ